MPTTSNFGWTTPADTDYVKDGALAIRTLGNGIDTSFVDLKGGTTGQVLSKTSNTDLDFTWVTTDDANAIQNAIVDAKGDLITATAADTPARLAVGSNGDTLVADSAATTGLRWQGNYAAGKNAIQNGDFRINQRAFTSNTTDGAFNFDRWAQANSGVTQTITPQTFTAGAAPVAGYEAINFLQSVTSGGTSSSYAFILQPIEDVRKFAGETVTFSFWAKASSGTPKVGANLTQYFGSGGSSNVNVTGQAATISTSWARYSFTFSVPSVSGKTIGTGSYLRANIWLSAGTDLNTNSGSIGLQNGTFGIWGVQIEAGSVATGFQTSTGTLQGERSACERYYFDSRTATWPSTTTGIASANNKMLTNAVFATTMRAKPTITLYSYANTANKVSVFDGVSDIGTSMTAASNGISTNNFSYVQDSGTGLTANSYYWFGFTASAEL